MHSPKSENLVSKCTLQSMKTWYQDDTLILNKHVYLQKFNQEYLCEIVIPSLLLRQLLYRHVILLQSLYIQTSLKKKKPSSSTNKLITLLYFSTMSNVRGQVIDCFSSSQGRWRMPPPTDFQEFSGISSSLISAQEDR